uniref:WD_REPEATS_REGION domain-containing protein n=1 Tax=Parastrongyloides trichosuri TaxID=131310 RepID=A0A0N4ZZ05_PARTI
MFQQEVLAGEFCKDENFPGLFAIGLYDGSVVIGNAENANISISKNCLYNLLSPHRTHVNALSFINNSSSKLLSISSEDPVYLRDIHKNMPIEAFKTDISLIKCLTLNKYQQNIFAVGGRDNNIAIFDVRNEGSVLSKHLQHFESDKILRLPQPHWQFSKNTTYSKNAKFGSKDMVVSTLSAMAFLNEFQFITGSSVSMTGIRCWDIRYISNKPNTEPLFTYKMPSSKRDYGVAYLTVDSSKSQFYATCTNKETYIFSSIGSYESPMYTLPSNMDINYSIKTAIIPNSNNLLVGTTADSVEVFDLSPLYERNISKLQTSEDFLPSSKYLLKGHDMETNVVHSSIDGKYILTGSASNVRIWEYGWDRTFQSTGEEFNQIEKPVRINRGYYHTERPLLNFSFPTSKLGLKINLPTFNDTPKRNKNPKRKLAEKNDNGMIKKGKYFPVFGDV